LNFFGHAVAASWVSASPAFAYGSMLPDLLSMVGARRVECDDPEIKSGVRFHHLTDRCFHGDATFAALESDAREQLALLGVRKGPRRALSHVGIELLLDAVLARSTTAVSAYRMALAVGESSLDVRVLPQGDATALRSVARFLRERSTYLVPKDAVEATHRMARVLSRRPLLAFDENEEFAVLRWTRQAMPRVETITERWMAALREVVIRDFAAARAAAQLRTAGSR
jgi:hypothetical protein